MAILSYFRQSGRRADHNVSHVEKRLDPGKLLCRFSNMALGGANLAEDQKLQAQAFANAPIFSVAAQTAGEKLSGEASSNTNLIPQFGLIGLREDVDEASTVADRLIMSNLNVPWSAFICGSQGAGKSHTLSCLLEAYLLKNNPTSVLSYPMAGMVLHYDHFTSESTTQVCEAAYLCSSGIPLNISRILKMMAVDPTGKGAPLYMETVMRIIREMAMEGQQFTYTMFRERLSATTWLRDQETSLKIRLQLLDTFLTSSLTPSMTKPAAAEQDPCDFQPGTLTIVDLSDPFLTSDDACSLFSVCLSIFLEGRDRCGRVAALDEAHKFLTQSGEAHVLTEELISIIRQQRHTGTRVLIATQEPTLSPKLLDLSNATFVHRFSPPAWYKTLRSHLAGLAAEDEGNSSAAGQREQSTFGVIAKLCTGEALLFCPTAQIHVSKARKGGLLQTLGPRYVRVQIRQRTTFDGGVSMAAATATDQLSKPTSSRVTSTNIRMHIATTAGSKKDDQSLARYEVAQWATGSHVRPKSSMPAPTCTPTAIAASSPNTVDRPVQSSSNRTASARSQSPASSSTTAVTTGSSRKNISKKSSARIKVHNRQHLSQVAYTRIEELAKRLRWNRATVVSKTDRMAYLAAFEKTVQCKGPKLGADDVKTIYLSAFGSVLENEATANFDILQRHDLTAVLAAFPASTRVLHSTKWRSELPNQPAIDPYEPRLNLFPNPPDPSGIFCQQHCCKTIGVVVCKLNRLLLRIKLGNQAYLALVLKGRRSRSLDSLVEVDVIEYDCGILSAELEREVLVYLIRGVPADADASGGAAVGYGPVNLNPRPRKRFALVYALPHGKRLVVLLYQLCHAAEICRAGGAGGFLPRLEGLCRDLEGLVDLLGTGDGDLGEHSTGFGVDGILHDEAIVAGRAGLDKSLRLLEGVGSPDIAHGRAAGAGAGAVRGGDRAHDDVISLENVMGL
ncbi:hypothetical protein HG530_015864 [Fusarium avenaceum]|nr:hypothetical protein HG530_015864 [Fusarium avenaceum]